MFSTTLLTLPLLLLKVIIVKIIIIGDTVAVVLRRRAASQQEGCQFDSGPEIFLCGVLHRDKEEIWIFVAKYKIYNDFGLGHKHKLQLFL